jgi:glycosyltransferase involved in cell wall biosynthesis
VLEAFLEGTPVACSAVTALPEYGGDAVHLFDPTSVESIAEAMRRMAMDAELRAELRQRGAVRIRLFTWERTAKTYRALYRKAAERRLSDEDRSLLASALAHR